MQLLHILPFLFVFNARKSFSTVAICSLVAAALNLKKTVCVSLPRWAMASAAVTPSVIKNKTPETMRIYFMARA